MRVYDIALKAVGQQKMNGKTKVVYLNYICQVVFFLVVQCQLTLLENAITFHDLSV